MSRTTLALMSDLTMRVRYVGRERDPDFPCFLDRAAKRPLKNGATSMFTLSARLFVVLGLVSGLIAGCGSPEEKDDGGKRMEPANLAEEKAAADDAAADAPEESG